MSTEKDTLWHTRGVNPLALAHAQHLLRNLHNGPALAENPFVAGLGVGAVRRMLAHLDSRMAEEAAHRFRDSSLARQYEIFRRCDLRGEPHTAVAADLGISRRQFYRERRQIAHRIAAFFSGEQSDTARMHAAIRLARRELLHGRPSAALIILDGLGVPDECRELKPA